MTFLFALALSECALQCAKYGSTTSVCEGKGRKGREGGRERGNVCVCVCVCQTYVLIITVHLTQQAMLLSTTSGNTWTVHVHVHVCLHT